MAKWADYLISVVRYDEDHERIVKVRVHEDIGDKVGVAFSLQLVTNVGPENN